ncbi:MAG: DUF4396 domain-containing protein, partial [Pseudomonadota bacterium]
LANGWDGILEYLAGFISGLFVFQALMMRGMYDGNYWLAVRKTLFAETVSMNMVMTGMLPVMIILADLIPSSESPLNASFWFRMGIASIVGGIIAYPINYWMVRNHLKHGCMTLPDADGPAPGLGHQSPEAMGDGEHRTMHMGSLSTGQAVAWVAGTYVILLLAMWLTSLFVPISFASG